jgi:urate oxidase
MAIIMGDNQYGKAENRVVRIYRDSPRHEIRDLNVSTALRGPFEAAHTVGNNTNVLTTDAQKNTAFAFAKLHGVATIEDYALTLARHFVREIEPVEGARIEVEEYTWDRVVIDGVEHDHTWTRRGPEIRTAAVTVDASGEYVVGGIKDLVILKSTGSEFHDFLRETYTTLPDTNDRVMATSLVAHWRFTTTEVDWDAAYAGIKAAIVREFATLQSLALQQTLWAIGHAVLSEFPSIAEMRLSAPNKHHFVVDLSPFGLENPGEVFISADRPYGLIQATVTRDDAPPAGEAWRSAAGLA